MTTLQVTCMLVSVCLNTVLLATLARDGFKYRRLLKRIVKLVCWADDNGIDGGVRARISLLRSKNVITDYDWIDLKGRET